MDSSRLETVLEEDVWSSLSNGLKGEKQDSTAGSYDNKNEICLGNQRGVPPGDLQVQFHCSQVVNIHRKCLGQWAEQVEHFAGHTAHHHVIGQALQLCHLDEKQANLHEDMRRSFKKNEEKPGSTDDMWSRFLHVLGQSVVTGYVPDFDFCVPQYLSTVSP